jgi:hypothetical protein
MKEIVQEIIGWSFPLANIAIIIIAATRKKFPGKPWLVTHLGIGLALMLAWRIPSLLLKFDTVDSSWFYEHCTIPLSIIGLASFCLLIPFVLAVANPSHLRSTEGACMAAPPNEICTGDTSSPFYGVHGWLKFFVVVNMYIAPVLFGIQ